LFFFGAQAGEKPIKKRKHVSGGRLVVEILTPQSISSNTHQYVTRPHHSKPLMSFMSELSGRLLRHWKIAPLSEPWRRPGTVL
jgi:hypothetical protein